MTELSSLLHTLLPLAEAIVSTKDKLDHIDDLDREIQDMLATEAKIASRVANAEIVIAAANKAVEDTKELTASANKAIEDAKAQANEIIESARAAAEREAKAVQAKAEKKLADIDNKIAEATLKFTAIRQDIEAAKAERSSIISAIADLKAKLG